jgi:D-alanyl-D-alanine carboxypeptidase
VRVETINDAGQTLNFAMDHAHPLGAPGTAFTYSDAGYILLGDLVERVNGTGLAEAYRMLLRFETLGLDLTWLESLEPAPAGIGQRAHQFLGPEDSFNLDPSFDLYGGGGLVATIDDVAHFYQALLAGQVFDDPATLRTMLDIPSINTGGYAVGIGRLDISGNTCWSHSGFWGTTVISCPELGVTAAVSAGQNNVFDRAEMDSIFMAAFAVGGVPLGAEAGAAGYNSSTERLAGAIMASRRSPVRSGQSIARTAQ